MFVSIPHAAVRAVRSAVPDQEVRIEDELEYYDGSLKKAGRARTMIGTDRRRLVWPGQTASDLCRAAAESLLAAHPSCRDEVDAIVFVSQSPDYDLPATACILQQRLGLPQTCAAFDVNQGCSGYVYGLWLAAGMIHSGCRNVLLLAGDAASRPRDRSNRVIAPIFGDGGSATLVSRSDDAPPLTFSLGTDGAGYDHIIQPVGLYRVPFSHIFEENRPFYEEVTDARGVPWRAMDAYMDGQAVFSFTLRVIPRHIVAHLEQAAVTRDEIDHFVLHQANRQIISEIVKKAGLPPEKTPSETFSRYGNLSSASIPAALCDLFGEAGHTGEKKLLLCGYGVGLSWASCLWQAENCDCAPVVDVPKPETPPTPEAWMNGWRERLQGEHHELG